MQPINQQAQRSPLPYILDPLNPARILIQYCYYKILSNIIILHKHNFQEERRGNSFVLILPLAVPPHLTVKYFNMAGFSLTEQCKVIIVHANGQSNGEKHERK
jgi:hypothetical protein